MNRTRFRIISDINLNEKDKWVNMLNLVEIEIGGITYVLNVDNDENVSLVEDKIRRMKELK